MTFFADSSTQGVLVVAGIILVMFMLILILAFLNNRSVTRLANRLRRGRAREQTDRVQVENLPGGSVRLVLFLTAAILAAGGLLWWFANRSPR